jgi:hypothetical protein
MARLIRIGEGQLFNEVVLLVLKIALLHISALVPEQAPGVLRKTAVHAREPTSP